MLIVETAGPVVRITLNRPQVHNAFNDELIAAIMDAFRSVAFNDSARVVILAAAGGSFSAGGDLNWMKRAATYSYEQNVSDARTAAEMFLAIARCPKPVIARVQGAAFGGGAGLVATCDISIAVESAQFGFGEVKLGIIPSIIAPFVIGRIGQGNAREYFLTGERFQAATAKAMGLVQHVVPDEAALDALIETKISEILTASPAAIAAAKQLIFDVAGRPFESTLDITADAIARARASADGRAGIEAFLARSKPPWIPK